MSACRFDEGQAEYKLFDDESLGRSAEALTAAAARVEAGTSTGRKEGVHAGCCLHKQLTYLHPQLFFLVPVWHCLLYGVVKGFITYALSVVCEASLKHIKAAGIPKAITTTAEAGRKYRCVWRYM